MAGSRVSHAFCLPPHTHKVARFLFFARAARNKTCRENSDNPTPAPCAAWATSRFSDDGILSLRTSSFTVFAILMIPHSPSGH